MSENNLNLIRQEADAYGHEYKGHLFEQYKLYIEIADRINSRRMLENSFFVGVHTILVTTFTILLKDQILQASLLGIPPFLAVLLLCFVWWRVVYSYRKLNTGKFKGIIALEQMLPIAPYDTEWVALGGGKDRRLYLPLTHIENWVPACFGALYILLAIALYS